MKTLLIMRHGKSDWSGPAGSDIERILAPRGRNASMEIGRHLSSLPVDAVISSPATRAFITAQLVLEAAAWDAPLTIDNHLYGASVPSVLSQINQLDTTLSTVLMTGHQPTWSHLVSSLTGQPSLDFPTAAVACIDFDDAWAGVRPGSGDLRWFITPRALAEQNSKQEPR